MKMRALACGGTGTRLCSCLCAMHEMHQPSAQAGVRVPPTLQGIGDYSDRLNLAREEGQP